jgi:hypothetical protein
MKIAICLSGQPRTIKYTYNNILNHFSNYDVDYFCQSWDYSSYKEKKENRLTNWTKDYEENKLEVEEYISKFNPKKIKIQSRGAEPVSVEWGTMFYSMAYANYLKKQYEIENNFRYDFVVKTRYDTIFDPNDKFYIDRSAKSTDPYSIFVSYKHRMTYEYNRLNANDVFFYGSSLAMDIMNNLYSYTVFKMKTHRYDNREHLGPGVRMTDLAEALNVDIKVTKRSAELVYRKDSIPLDPMTDYEELKKIHNSYYQW